MNRTIIVALVVMGAIGWRLSYALTSDALAMAIGVLFGVVAGIPTALIMMASGRRSQEIPDSQTEYWRRRALEAQADIKHLEAQLGHHVSLVDAQRHRQLVEERYR